jgi:hypothetical protein
LHENGENNNLEQSITQLLTNDATDASVNEMQDPDQKVVVADVAAATMAVAQSKSAKRQLEPATTGTVLFDTVSRAGEHTLFYFMSYLEYGKKKNFLKQRMCYISLQSCL